MFWQRLKMLISQSSNFENGAEQTICGSPQGPPLTASRRCPWKAVRCPGWWRKSGGILSAVQMPDGRVWTRSRAPEQNINRNGLVCRYHLLPGRFHSRESRNGDNDGAGEGTLPRPQDPAGDQGQEGWGGRREMWVIPAACLKASLTVLPAHVCPAPLLRSKPAQGRKVWGKGNKNRCSTSSLLWRELGHKE